MNLITDDDDHDDELTCSTEITEESSVSSFASEATNANCRTHLLRQRRRRVRFASDDQTVTHSYEKCFSTKDEQHRIWYNAADLKQIKKDNYQGLMEHTKDVDRVCCLCDDNILVSSLDQENWTWRGFEYVLHRSPRKELRLEHTRGVVAFQNCLGSNAPLALAHFCANSSSTNGSLERALQQAQQDEQECHDEEQQQQQQQQQQKVDDNDTVSTASTVESSCCSWHERTETDAAAAVDDILPFKTPIRRHATAFGKHLKIETKRSDKNSVTTFFRSLVS